MPALVLILRTIYLFLPVVDTSEVSKLRLSICKKLPLPTFPLTDPSATIKEEALKGLISPIDVSVYKSPPGNPRTTKTAGIAEKEIGAAAVGAMAEKEHLFGKALILTVLPETLVIFGLVIAILILGA